MSEWQPIETAPKDGEYVLLYDRHNDPDRFVGFYTEVSWVLHGVDDIWIVTPDAWMPLPDPPESPKSPPKGNRETA